MSQLRGNDLRIMDGLTISEIYSDRLNFSLFERLQLRKIDPPRRPCQFGNGAPRSEREQSSLRFGFVSSVQKGTNSTDLSIAEETVWLTQKMMGVLFEVSLSTINEQLSNLFSQNEISRFGNYSEFPNNSKRRYTQTTSKFGQWTGLKAAENRRPQAS